MFTRADLARNAASADAWYDRNMQDYHAERSLWAAAVKQVVAAAKRAKEE